MGLRTLDRMQPKLLLPLALLLLLALGAGLWSVLGGEPPEELTGLEVGVRSGALEETTALPEQAREELAAPVRIDYSLETTVVHPLKLTFELVGATGKLDADDVPPLGYAASARLRGSIHGANGRPVRGAYAEFVAGPNVGRVLETDDDGRFGANDLYAGLSIVALRAAGTVGAEREVLLREKRDAELNVGFGRPASLSGVVRDERNAALPLAKVVVDGQQTMSDELGRFELRNVASGKVPVYVSKPGYASHREMLYVTAGTRMEPGKLRYNLRKGATVKIVVPERLGLGRPGKLFLSGTLDGTASRNYPWHHVSPRDVFAGESIEIEDLPQGTARFHLFMPGAKAEPSAQNVALFSGQTKTVTFHLEPAAALVGRVTRDGKPVEGALVQLEAPDVTGAGSKLLGGRLGRAQFEAEVLSQVPPALQTSVTKSGGRFEFSAAEDLSEVRYITAKSRDGKAWAGRVVRSGERDVELELQEAVGGEGAFVIETSERFQAIKVDYIVDGKPYTRVLPAGQRLEIEGLAEGTWRVKARWSTERILDDVTLTLKGTEELFVPLPKGAIDGQSKRLRDAMQ